MTPCGEPHTVYYIVVEGPNYGIYKNYAEFTAARDKPQDENTGFSYRAGYFWCKEDAKNWVQARLHA